MSHISRLFWHTICFPSSYHHFTFFSKNTPKSSLEIIHIFRYQSHICSTPSSPPFSVCTFLISFVPQLYQSSSKLQRKVLYDITFTEGVNISPQRPDSEPFFLLSTKTRPLLFLYCILYTCFLPRLSFPLCCCSCTLTPSAPELTASEGFEDDRLFGDLPRSTSSLSVTRTLEL